MGQVRSGCGQRDRQGFESCQDTIPSSRMAWKKNSASVSTDKNILMSSARKDFSPGRSSVASAALLMSVSTEEAPLPEAPFTELLKPSLKRSSSLVSFQFPLARASCFHVLRLREERLVEAVALEKD